MDKAIVGEGYNISGLSHTICFCCRDSKALCWDHHTKLGHPSLSSRPLSIVVHDTLHPSFQYLSWFKTSSLRGEAGYPWTEAVSCRLRAAIDQLVGRNNWEDFGCGWWVVTFPGFAAPPWRVEGKWHVDGAHFTHFPRR